MKAGLELGPSRWVDVDQERVDRFASATEDSQWIHTNRERAAAGPFGTTIAHGFLTLHASPPRWSERVVRSRSASPSSSSGSCGEER
jgi:acyl dehydratase